MLSYLHARNDLLKGLEDAFRCLDYADSLIVRK